MAGAWSGPPPDYGGYRTGQGGYGTRDGYGYDPRWDRQQPAYGEDPWGDGYYPDGPADGGWDYDDQRHAYEVAQQRAARRARARARAAEEEFDTAAAGYPMRPVASRGGRRRRVLLSALVGGALALLGERAVRIVNRERSASAATGGGGQAGTGGGDGMAPSGGPSASGSAAPAAVLARTSDIPVGSAKIFAAHKTVVTQPTAGVFKAFSTVCTHAGCILDHVKGDKSTAPATAACST